MPRLLFKIAKITSTESVSQINQNLFITASCSLYPKHQVLQSALFAGPNPFLNLPKGKEELFPNLTIFDIPIDNNAEYEFEFAINLYLSKERTSVWKSLPYFDNLYNALDKKNFNGIIPPEPDKQLSAFVPQLLSRTASHLHLGKENAGFKQAPISFGKFCSKVESGDKTFTIKMKNHEIHFESIIANKRCFFETKLIECQILNEFDDEIYLQLTPDNNELKEGFAVKQFLSIGDTSDKRILKTFSQKLNFTLLEADSGVVSIFDKDDIIGSMDIMGDAIKHDGIIEFSGEEGSYKILYNAGEWV